MGVEMLSLRSIKSFVGLCALILPLASPPAHAAQGIDTTTSDLPFSIGGAQVMDLTTGGLNVVRGSITLTGCVLSGNGGFTSTNCPFTVSNGRLTSTNNQGDWAGVFYGSTYGVYSHAPGWAGYFDGPTMLNGATTVNGSLIANGGINVNSGTNLIVNNGEVVATQNQNNWTAWLVGNTGLGVYAHGATWAGYFDGPVNVTGSLSVNNSEYLNGNLCLNGDCRSTWPSATNTTQYINGGCPGGSVMTGVSNGAPICAAAGATSNCPSGQVMFGLSNGQPVCVNAGATANCPSGQVVVGASNGQPVCGAAPTTYVNAGCPSGYALSAISNNAPVCTPIVTSTPSAFSSCHIVTATDSNSNSFCQISARCASNEIATGGGGYNGVTQVSYALSSSDTTTPALTDSNPDPDLQGWTARSSAVPSFSGGSSNGSGHYSQSCSITSYAVCCPR